MPRQGLNMEKVVRKAAEMIDRQGPDFFSVNRLAARLGVRPASLYNHIESADGLKREVASYSARLLRRLLAESAGGKSRGEAVKALARRYREFGTRHRWLYRMIAPPFLSGKKDGDLLMEPIMASLSGFRLTRDGKIHRQRILRAIADGFVTDENRGFFSGQRRPAEESFEKALDLFIARLGQAEEENMREG